MKKKPQMLTVVLVALVVAAVVGIGVWLLIREAYTKEDRQACIQACKDPALGQQAQIICNQACYHKGPLGSGT